MKLNHLSNNEFVNYVSLYNTDPVVARLLDIINEGNIVSDLVDIGMNPITHTFDHDYSNLTPADYIEQLRKDKEWAEEEAADTEYKNSQLRKEVEEYKTTTLIDFIGLVKQELKTAQWSSEESRKIAEREKELRKEAEQKWDMWDKLHHGIRS